MRLLPSHKFQLRIAGSGDMEDELRALSLDMENVHFVGHLDNPAEFLARCDVLAMPSYQEAFGLVCAEAKAAALPVVVSNVDGLPEQVTNCGEIVEPGRPDELAGAILRVCSPERYSALSFHARESMKDAWLKYMNQWTEILI